MKLRVALLLLALVACSAFATERDPAQRRAFQKSHPCPSTGKTKGACPGYVVDHVKPLCAGGADRPSNMQWQTVAASKEKDKRERAECSSKKRRATP